MDAACTAMQEDGAEIVYPLHDEEWGVRRFFVRDPDGPGDQRAGPSLTGPCPVTPSSYGRIRRRSPSGRPRLRHSLG